MPHTVCWVHQSIYMLYIPVCSYVESDSVLDADDDTTSTVSPTRRRSPRKDVWNTEPPTNVYAPHEVWMLWLGCLSITTVHGACDRPRCLRIVNSGIHAPHPLDFRGVIIKPPKPPILHNVEHLKHFGPCRQRSLSSLE